MFKGFDYGLINEATGEYKILSRSENTAFLTKHLRAYGGSGKYQDHKVGRVLRSITFSGKGYVDKPANPDSIIFNKENFSGFSYLKNADKSFSGVSDSRQNPMEVNNMSLEKEVAELQDKVEAMSDCAQATKDAFAQVKELQDKIVALETAIAEKDSEIASNKAALEELTAQTEAAKKMTEEEMMKKEEEMKKAKSDLDAALETVAVYKSKEEEMMKKEKKMKRMATLIENGLDTELATSTVDKFENLDDASFDSMTEVFAAMMPMKKKKMEEKQQELVAPTPKNLKNRPKPAKNPYTDPEYRKTKFKSRAKWLEKHEIPSAAGSFGGIAEEEEKKKEENK